MAAELSEAARSYRTGMLAMIALVFIGVVLAFAGAKGWIDSLIVTPAILIIVAAALGAAWFGLKGHSQVRQDRERASGQFMIVAIAAQLGKQDDETLQKIAGRGGPAGEAAKMLIEGRRQKGRPSSAAPSIRPRAG